MKALNFDFYAKEPQLFIKGQFCYRTNIGLFLSLVTVICLFFLLLFIYICFDNDTGLKVLYNKNSKGMDNINLDLSKNIFFYSLNDFDGKPIDKRFIKIFPYLTSISVKGTENELLEETNCDISKLKNENEEYQSLIDFDISAYQCLKTKTNEDAIIKRESTPFSNSYINLFIVKCTNDTELKLTDCASNEEIDDYIEKNSIFVTFYLESTSIDHHDYKKPIKKKYYRNDILFPKEFIFSYSFFWRKVDYITKDTFILFSNLFQYSSFLLDASIKEKDFYSKDTLFYVDQTIGRLQFLIAEDYGDYYERSYSTLIDSVAIFMGGYSLITKICYGIHYLLTYSHIFNAIFEPIIDKPRKTSSLNNSSVHLKRRNIMSNIFYDSFKGFESSKPAKMNRSKTLFKESKKNGICIYQKSSMVGEEINDILDEIQEKKIDYKVRFFDILSFLICKLFKCTNKRQLYLRKIVSLLLDELSIDYIFIQLKNIELFFATQQNLKNGRNSSKNKPQFIFPPIE